MKIIGIVENNFITGIVYGVIEIEAPQVPRKKRAQKAYNKAKHHKIATHNAFNNTKKVRLKTYNMQQIKPRNHNINNAKFHEIAARNAYNNAQKNKLKTCNKQLKTKHK